MAFAPGNAILGGFEYLFLSGVGPEAAPGLTISHLTFMVFQLMFAIITPALITGAFAERMKFTGMLLFMVLWAFVVYFPMAHMVWGPGGLLNVFDGGAIGCLDFAGGDGRSHLVRRLGSRLRPLPRKAERISYRQHAPP